MTTRRLFEAAEDLLDRIQTDAEEADGWEETTELRQALTKARETPRGRGTGRTWALLSSIPAGAKAFIVVGHAAIGGQVRELWKQIGRDARDLRVAPLEGLQREADALALQAANERLVGRIDHTVWQRLETPAQFALLLEIRRRFNIPSDPAME